METEKEIEDVVNKFDFNHLYEIINRPVKGICERSYQVFF